MTRCLRLAVVFVGFLGLGCGSAPLGDAWTVPVLVIAYFPVAGDSIDREITGDWGASLTFTRAKTQSVTEEVIATLEAGSTYRGYRDPEATPSLRYEIVETVEHLAPLPTKPRAENPIPITDYGRIMSDNDVETWVRERGVKEVWIWGYHGGVLDLWESNMAGPWGDISNSNRDSLDLPVLDRTYTVYHYNYQRGTSEAVENHMHQLEHLINYVDGRDATAEDAWDQLLFWGRFVGSDISHRIVRPGCGWSHIPPNGERDYDWANPRVVESDCEDWQPDGGGSTMPVSCDRWNCNSLDWFVYWTQHIPGRNHGLTYQGRPLTNWWRLVGDFDGAMAEGEGLVAR